MTWLPLSFGAPLVLAGLVVLPVIWWLLRMTPPKPQMEIFPPLRILASVLKREETPHQSPWWLTLLRLVMATLIILALADPVLNPRERMAAGGGATAILMDNGWASASDWQVRVATAERLIADAEASGVPVILAFSAEEANEPVGPFDAAAARDRLNAAAPDRCQSTGLPPPNALPRLSKVFPPPAWRFSQTGSPRTRTRPYGRFSPIAALIASYGRNPTSPPCWASPAATISPMSLP